MDGTDRLFNNMFIERLWRSLKYECAYLHAWDTGSEARAGLRNWLGFYTDRRPHAALDGQPPNVVYRTGTTITQPDQETRKVAQKLPDPVQGSGSNSAFPHIAGNYHVTSGVFPTNASLPI